MFAKILLLIFTFIILFKSDQAFNQDLGRHIKAGEIIAQNFSVPKINLFSYTNPDFPFINTHWLFGVIIFLVSQVTGFQLLLVFKILIFLLAIWITLKIIPEEKSILFLPLGFIFFHVLRERTDLRPEIFSFLFTAITYYLLEKFSNSGQKYDDRTNFVQRKGILLLPVIQLIWINTHIYFFVGLVLQAIFLVYFVSLQLYSHSSSGKLKLLSYILVLSVILSLMNPNGLDGLLYPLRVGGNYGYSIVENQSIFLLEKISFSDPNFLFVKISVGIILFILILSLLRKRFNLKNTLVAVFGLFLALMHVRGLPYLVLLSLPATMMSLGKIKKGAFTLFLTIVTCFLLFLESFFYLNGDYYRSRNSNAQNSLIFEENGKEALDFVIKNNLPQPIFNNFDIGSYIIYRGYPQYKVFVDGRPESYPAKFFQETYIPMQSDYSKFEEAEKLYSFKTVIFSHTDQTPWGQNFLQNIVKDPEWKTVFIDDFMIILTKKGLMENLQAIDLSKLQPSEYRFDYYLSYLRLGIFLYNMGFTEGSSGFFAKVNQLSPDNPTLSGKRSRYFW